MRKDKITIFYVLITLSILIAASIFIYNIDLRKNNAQISEQAERVYGSGKQYSKKVYSMLSAYTDDVENYFSEDKKVKKVKVKKKLLVTTVPTTIETSNFKKKDINVTKHITSSIIIKTTKDSQ